MYFLTEAMDNRINQTSDQVQEHMLKPTRPTNPGEEVSSTLTVWRVSCEGS